ncbi:GlsB/YeaQ/YmgE family stress response membrane protein [Streptomyces longispororuber]|uniref:GlsB/YeaQ/YmgE family stress response membrane protein n=1 Tax=Streptomyces TaxID=1883 RepID=UPI0024A9ECB7|nr:GlsB/YeaQ/YmgE family stress response membrane protein [Streptomyces sp. CC224B]
MGIVTWIVVGLVAGAVAKALTPGKGPGGAVVTMLIGMAGGMLGGLLGALVFGVRSMNGLLHLSTWVAAVAGSVLIVLAYRTLSGRAAH